MTVFDQRRSGVLLHPTSLPGAEGIGTLGAEARHFIDFLAASGQTLWQILPLGPTGHGNSPYSSFSAFAGSPLLIDLQQLVDEGDLPPDALPPPEAPSGRVNYDKVRQRKLPLLRLAAETFFQAPSSLRQERFEQFCREHASWLDDYALYQALRSEMQQCHWLKWPVSLRQRDSTALEQARQRLQLEVRQQKYLQFVFGEQWSALKAYANQRDVLIFGDIPIFVAEDSADVWAHPDIFELDETGQPVQVAGVPPDYFSETGQRWGNPLYDWPTLAQRGYDWWIERFRRNLEMFDLVRIDHFRGFAAHWAIPADEKTAINGTWEPGPGADLFTTLQTHFTALPVVAEDLGVITPDVEQLRDRFGFPGMKILHFAFDSGPANPYLPHNIPPSSVVYTGTHDNNTTLGWWAEQSEQNRHAVWEYLGLPLDDMPWPLIRTALASTAALAIFPMQDLLGLGADARMNLPGAATGNWDWQLASLEGLESLQNRLRTWTHRYGRLEEV